MKSNQLEASKSNIAAGDVSTYDSQPGAANYRRAMNILTVALLIGALGAAVRTQDVQAAIDGGGGVDGEDIELVFIKREDMMKFVFDESKVKGFGLIFAYLWWEKFKS